MEQNQGQNDQNQNSGVVKQVTKSAIRVEEIRQSAFKKGGKNIMQAILKQDVVTVSSYPSTRVSSDLQDSIFGSEELGIEKKDFTSTEVRTAFLPVPDNATVESVTAELSKYPNASIYRILSNSPILSDNQKAAIDSDKYDLEVDTVANRQAVRYPENHKTTPNQLILDNAGNVQYRQTFFSKDGTKIDQDLRSREDVYLSTELKTELQGAGAVNANQAVN